MTAMKTEEPAQRLRQTLAYYQQNADSFAAGSLAADMAETRERFTALLPFGARILDFGCGAGRDAKAFLDAGFQVEAADGSPEMCARASEYTGIPVKRMLFQELDVRERYDGIWACSSILHLAKEELAEVIRRIGTALKRGGILYTSFKYGAGEKERGGRFFTDFTEETILPFWKAASELKIISLWVTHDVRPGREGERWLNLLARRDSSEGSGEDDPLWEDRELTLIDSEMYYDLLMEQQEQM